MECDDHKVSAERCLFLMLLNEDGLEENIRKSGKDRLTAAWEFKGERWRLRTEAGRTATPPNTLMERTYIRATAAVVVGIFGYRSELQEQVYLPTFGWMRWWSFLPASHRSPTLSYIRGKRGVRCCCNISSGPWAKVCANVGDSGLGRGQKEGKNPNLPWPPPFQRCTSVRLHDGCCAFLQTF